MLVREVIAAGTSARWHAVLYFAVAAALILLAYETLAMQTLNGTGIEFTVGSGYAHVQTAAPIYAEVKSHAPFILESSDRSIRLDMSANRQEFQADYERDIEIPAGEFDFRLTLGSNVTVKLRSDADASATVVPYNVTDSSIFLIVTGMSVLGSLYFAFRALRGSNWQSKLYFDQSL
mgnify:CR=1 FL=1